MTTDQPAGSGSAPPPLRIVQVGAGAMGRWWLQVLALNPDVELVGLVDLDVAAARRAAEATGHPEVPVAATIDELAATGTEALLNVAVPHAHHPLSTAALLRGLPVLCEKPVAESVSEALSMAATAEYAGRLLMVSQSRRYFRALSALRRQLAGLGRVALVGCEFAKNLDFRGNFRGVMAHPLLVDMAIHHFDLARLLVGSDPVRVYCETSNPGWSTFAGDAVATAIFEFAGGARFAYAGSWVAPGLETSWNGRWRVSAERGTAIWDGDHDPYGADAAGGALPVEAEDEPQEIAGSLVEFVRAVRTGALPQGEVHSNAISLAMVEAAVASADSGEPVLIADVLERGLEQAIRDEQRPQIRAVLQAWPSAAEALGYRSAGVARV